MDIKTLKIEIKHIITFQGDNSLTYIVRELSNRSKDTLDRDTISEAFKELEAEGYINIKDNCARRSK